MKYISIMYCAASFSGGIGFTDKIAGGDKWSIEEGLELHGQRCSVCVWR